MITQLSLYYIFDSILLVFIYIPLLMLLLHILSMIFHKNTLLLFFIAPEFFLCFFHSHLYMQVGVILGEFWPESTCEVRCYAFVVCHSLGSIYWFNFWFSYKLLNLFQYAITLFWYMKFCYSYQKSIHVIV